MRIQQVRNEAKLRGIHPGKLSKGELIKTIQLEEGNFDCYGSALTGECDQLECTWREDCFSAAHQGEIS